MRIMLNQVTYKYLNTNKFNIYMFTMNIIKYNST